MEFLQMLFVAGYLGTLLLIVYSWFRLAALRPRKAVWPMPGALGLWLLQAGVVLYFLLICISGHCRLTKVEEHGPVVLLVCVFAGIGGLLWFAWKQIADAGKTA